MKDRHYFTVLFYRAGSDRTKEPEAFCVITDTAKNAERWTLVDHPDVDIVWVAMTHNTQKALLEYYS